MNRREVLQGAAAVAAATVLPAMPAPIEVLRIQDEIIYVFGSEADWQKAVADFWQRRLWLSYGESIAAERPRRDGWQL